MSCIVGRRYGWDPELQGLCCRLAATVLIQPLTWEPPYAVSAAFKKKKKKQKKKQKNPTKKPKNKKKKKHYVY